MFEQKVYGAMQSASAQAQAQASCIAAVKPPGIIERTKRLEHRAQAVVEALEAIVGRLTNEPSSGENGTALGGPPRDLDAVILSVDAALDDALMIAAKINGML